MEISFDVITFAHLAAVIVGVVSSAVILYFGFKTNPVNQPLGIGQLSISLGNFCEFFHCLPIDSPMAFSVQVRKCFRPDFYPDALFIYSFPYQE
jgi:hypothetical protein